MQNVIFELPEADESVTPVTYACDCKPFAFTVCASLWDSILIQQGWRGTGTIASKAAAASALSHDRQEACSGFSIPHTYAPPALSTLSASAARTRWGVNGKCRRRAPVASKMAFPIAAGTIVIAVSPAPVAGTLAGVTNNVSIEGIS